MKVKLITRFNKGFTWKSLYYAHLHTYQHIRFHHLNKKILSIKFIYRYNNTTNTSYIKYIIYKLKSWVI